MISRIVAILKRRLCVWSWPEYGQDGESFKKNARALGCDMVDFKPELLPGSGAAAHT